MTTDGPILGRGRSGVVYLVAGPDGDARARKVFGSHGLTKLVQYALLGAPNPYMWCEAAVKTAVVRRRVLATLVRAWFGDGLRVVRGHAPHWEAGARVFALDMELVRGRHFPLRGPFNRRNTDRLEEFLSGVLRPLQAKLRESGCDGLLWQAGYGNPVGLANFMVERTEAGVDRPVWVDLESGVPALFPLNLWTLVAFYLPNAWKLGRPPFDDVDTAALAAYLDREAAALVDALGAEGLSALRADVKELESTQAEWKRMGRLACALEAARVRGAISADEVAHYAAHPLRWYAREALRMLRSAPASIATRVRALALWSWALPWRRMLVRGTVALFSHRARLALSHEWVRARAESWKKRQQLSEFQHGQLLASLTGRDESVFLADFGMHLATKPLVKVIEFAVLPGLVATGVMDGALAIVVGLMLGSVIRSLYTLARIVQCLITGAPRPWLALVVGTLPVVGNVAFPVELLYAGRRAEVALFLVYDTLAAFGRKLPIWGGPDTLTEHAFNRAATPFLPNRLA